MPESSHSFSLLLAIFAQLALMLFLFLMVSVKRQIAVAREELEMNDFAHKNQEPEASRRWVNNLNNQFELPLLFIPLLLFFYGQGSSTLIHTVLAWAFIIGRLAHTIVQVTGDNVRLRGMVFTVNFLALIGLFILFFAKEFGWLS